MADIQAPLESLKRYASAEPVFRVAGVITNRDRVNSVEDAIDLARAALPQAPLPGGATEISYRLNVPADKDGLRMNRIATWQTSTVAYFGFDMVPGAGTLPMHQIIHNLWERVIDVNTLQEAPLVPGTGGEALEKVIKEAVAIGEGGYEAL